MTTAAPTEPRPAPAAPVGPPMRPPPAIAGKGPAPLTPARPVLARRSLASMIAAPTVAQGDGVVVAGKQKTGKTSSFAFAAPAPIFIFTDRMGDDVLPASFKDKIKPDAWDDLPGAVSAGLTVLGALRQLRDEEHPYQTVVIDTMNDTEALIWDWIIAKDPNGISSIEEVGEGFGKGFTKAQEQVTVMLRILFDLASKRGMNWIIISHTDVKTDSDPSEVSYEKWALSLNKKAAAKILGAANTILFAVPGVTATNVGKGKAVKMRGGQTNVTRAIVRSRTGIDAGSRWLLPEEMILSWAVYEQEKARGKDLREQLNKHLSGLSLNDRADADRFLSEQGHSRAAVEQVIAGFNSLAIDTTDNANTEDKDESK